MEKRRRQKALESVFGKSSLSGDSINCAVACPVCDDKNKLKRKLIVRLDDGRYQCWVCGTKGSNILFLAKKHFGASSANLASLTDLKKANQKLKMSVRFLHSLLGLFSWVILQRILTLRLLCAI